MLPPLALILDNKNLLIPSPKWHHNHGMIMIVVPRAVGKKRSSELLLLFVTDSALKCFVCCYNSTSVSKSSE